MTDNDKKKNSVLSPDDNDDTTVSNVCMLPPAGTLHTPLAPIPANSNPAKLAEPEPGLPREGEQAFETLLVALDSEGIMEKTLEQRVAELEQEVADLKTKLATPAANKKKTKKTALLLKD